MEFYIGGNLKTREVIITGNDLTIEDVASVAQDQALPRLDPEARTAVIQAAKTIERLAMGNTPIYGVNTGVGVLANQRIQSEESEQLSRNQILSQLVGLGPSFPQEQVRAAMLVRANSMAKGYSGVRPEIIDLILAMLVKGVTPDVPRQGSLGSSGDLAPLSHIAVVFSCDPDPCSDADESGRAWYKNQLMSGADAMLSAGLERLVLGVKEGAALTNGISFSAGILALNWLNTRRLLQISEIAVAMSLVALRGISAAFDVRLHDVRPHPGQVRVAQRIRELTQGSNLMDSSERVQDAYSLRCTPQITGPAWDLLEFVKTMLTCELNAVSDNPVLFGETVLSSGHFHGEPVGLAADYLKIALAEVGAVSERRVYRLLSGHTNIGLPDMLITKSEQAGLQSGMTMLQYTSASLVHENQTLASPDSVYSLPTAAGAEDHNANATTAVQHLTQVINNLEKILAIELLAAAQALDLRIQENPESTLGEGVDPAKSLIRTVVPFQEKDRPMKKDIEAVIELIQNDQLIERVRNVA
jgi:histidine ammonia-lyase